MTNVAATTRAPKEKKADYYFIDSDAKRVDEIEQATGLEYVPLAGGSVVWQIPGATVGSVQTMLAVAGAKIELRNAGRGAAEPGPATARVARLVDGDWGDLSGTGGGRAPIDEDKLILAMQTVLSAKGKPFNESKVRTGFKDGGTIAGKAHSDGKSYRAACMKIVGVEEEYNKLTGKGATDLDSIADDDFA